jgi:hypothetical protein
MTEGEEGDYLHSLSAISELTIAININISDALIETLAVS